MVHLDDLPTDSVLRRHALTEMNRVLGLPPADSVLRRHHAQWQSVQPKPVPASPKAARSVEGRAPKAAPPSAAPAPAARPAMAAVQTTHGGLFGWLRRALGF